MRHLRLPLWTRWVLSFLLFGTLGWALFASTRGGDAVYSRDPAAEAEADRLARIVIAEDQKPSSAAWRQGRPGPRLQRAITGDVRRRVRSGLLTGRLERVRCRPIPARRSGRLRFSCTAVLDGIAYPFAGVADRRTRRLTWCKRDPASDPGLAVPVDRRCTS